MKKMMLLAGLLALLAAGCDSKPVTTPMPEANNEKPLTTPMPEAKHEKPVTSLMPEANDENCKHENIARIEDKSIQQALSSQCLRRGSYKPSSKRVW